ncbi:MAG: hypothetical protein M5U22_13870 [Thermoleophilia bacterium]|nr:hypothetical protein [Thermoleophilia bacterium]
MMTAPLTVAFVWHMHQPYYRTSAAGAFEMPWVRLHALKDYLDMVQLLEDFPALHHTFNLVPSLVEQLEDYARGEFRDVYWEHTLKPAADLLADERAFIVDFMCERSGHPRAQRYPRYLELARKKESGADRPIETLAGEFTDQEIRDLQVWFNLAWFDPVDLAQPPLSELVARGRDFTEDDKQVLAQVQQHLLGLVLPAYRKAQAEGRIEITTSPYFHAILPLLADSDLARVAKGDIALPPQRFAHPEDAAEQIDRALALHERIFGERPRGCGARSRRWGSRSSRCWPTPASAGPSPTKACWPAPWGPASCAATPDTCRTRTCSTGRTDWRAKGGSLPLSSATGCSRT